jgi:tape measure domain-containing protein
MADAQIRITADTSQAERALGGLTRALGALASIAVGGSLVDQFVKITASAQEMTNKLIFATGSIENANKTFGLLAETAKATGSNLGGTIDLFQKLAMSSTLAGSSTESLAYITSQFNKTLQISGASGAGAASALYQFAQAMQKGSLNGDEFRTITETNGFMMKVLEKQTGKTTSQLRQMASEGKLSAEIIAKALLESTEIAEAHGKTVQTIPQAYENLNTSLTVAIKNFSDASGIGNGLVKVLNLMSENVEILIGAIAGIAVATAALLIPLIPAATAMAILTGGAAVLGAAAVGAAIAYAAKEAGMFAEKSKAATKSQADLQKQAQAGVKITAQRTTEEENLDKALTKTIGKLRDETKTLQQSTGLRDLRIETEKVITAERRKYLDIGKRIPLDLEKELRIETRKKIIAEDNLKVRQSLLELQSATNIAGIQDQGQQQVTAKLEAYRLSLTKEVFEANKANLEAKIKETLVAESLQGYTNQQRQSALELKSLNQSDLDLREEQLAVDVARLKEGILFTKEMEQQIRLNSQNARLARESLETEKQRNLLTGTATNQTRAERISTATGVIAQSDPRLAMAQDYATKKRAIDEAIANSSKQIDDGSFNAYKQLVAARNNLDAEYRDAKEIADLQFNDRELLRSQSHEEAKFQHKLKVLQAGYDAANAGVLQEKRLNDQSLQNEISLATAKIEIANREVLARQAIGEAILNMEQKVADARLKQAGVTNQAILASVKQNQANVAMIQQGGVVGMQGMLGAMMSVTGQMASTNKRAFETHKAMAMTQAIISTYQAAAMAIAFPPGPPLSFIYVAGAIAAGLAQVAAIRSQTFSGRALGGPVMGGKPYIVGESGPELFTPSTTGSITRNSDLQGGGVTNVNFTIVANDTTGFDQLLASRKGVIQQIISDAMLEKGRRSMV